MKYNKLEDECESRKITKGEEIQIVRRVVLDIHVFAWWRGDDNIGECNGSGETMEGEFWSIF